MTGKDWLHQRIGANGGISVGNTRHRLEDGIARTTHLMNRGILQERSTSAHVGISHHASVVQPLNANILENHTRMAETIGIKFGEG